MVLPLIIAAVAGEELAAYAGLTLGAVGLSVLARKLDAFHLPTALPFQAHPDVRPRIDFRRFADKPPKIPPGSGQDPPFLMISALMIMAVTLTRIDGGRASATTMSEEARIPDLWFPIEDRCVELLSREKGSVVPLKPDPERADEIRQLLRSAFMALLRMPPEFFDFDEICPPRDTTLRKEYITKDMCRAILKSTKRSKLVNDANMEGAIKRLLAQPMDKSVDPAILDQFKAPILAGFLLKALLEPLLKQVCQ